MNKQKLILYKGEEVPKTEIVDTQGRAGEECHNYYLGDKNPDLFSHGSLTHWTIVDINSMPENKMHTAVR